MVIFGWVFAASLIVWSIIKATIGIRVSDEEENKGLDITDSWIGCLSGIHEVNSLKKRQSS